MRGLSPQYTAAAAAIDAANQHDPNRVTVRGAEQPLALAHGVLADEWVVTLHVASSGAAESGDETAARADTIPLDLVRLAARAHHLRRWELPRSDYPEGKAGYHRWKRDQRQRHATDVAAILRDAGYADADIERAQAWIRRDALATDPGSQLVEDAACLVFIETQLADVATKLDHDHLVDVIRKTARKMSPAALAAVSEIPLGDQEQSLLAAALTP